MEPDEVNELEQSKDSEVDHSIASSLPERVRARVCDVRRQSAGDVMKMLAAENMEPHASIMSVDDAGDSRVGSLRQGMDAGEHNLSNSRSAANRSSQAPADNATATDNMRNEVQSCIECEDQHAELVCLTCDEPFCRPCWGSLHRQGKRAEHTTQAMLGELMPAPTTETSRELAPLPPAQAVVESEHRPETSHSDADESLDSDDDEAMDGAHASDDDADGSQDSEGDEPRVKRRSKRRCLRGLAVGLDGSSVLEECHFIPLRLNQRERGLLAMLKGALNFSQYTDRVDVFTRWNKQRTINAELHAALKALAGMMVAGDAKSGEKMADLHEHLENNQEVFAEIFEVGRRFKITNPDKFRSFYGKMMFMLQDAQASGRAGLNLVNDIQMVYSFVEERGGLALLKDKRVVAATADVSGISMNKAEVREKVASKVEARKQLLRKYVSDTFSKEDVERVLDSIADANNYIAFNVAPVERMLDLLQSNFHPDKPEEDWSLKLTGTGGRKRFSSASFNSGYGSFGSYGYGGGYGLSMFGPSTAMLSHDHRTQFTFVMQSLRLWSDAMRNMYRLWYFADSDLLSGKATYRLLNTGQGLNRVQSCPSISREMQRILRIVQSECGPWVGLSVVHLGDRDVPNALVFIDKYTQIPRLLNPVAEAVRSLEEMALDPVVGNYVDVGWGGVRNAKMAILSDFFKGGFDGSGDDGGSCIDGRLTSAWNWCSLLPKKPFAPIFNLAGQFGFDGAWGNGLEE